jgi:glycosyltransferase involved in cell wall biosynthesis
MSTVLHTESSPGLGGQELRTLNEARWIREHGWRVLLAGPPRGRLLRRAEDTGVETAPVPMRGAWDALAVARLVRTIRHEGVDIVHTHSSVDAWVGGLAGRLTGRPVVRTRHVSIPIRGRWNPVYTALADRVLTSGEVIRALVEAAGVSPSRIVVIPAGVDLEEFPWRERGDGAAKAVRKELGLGSPVVGSVAMFRGSKGHLPLLEAFGALHRRVPSARLVLVGDGLRRSWAQDLAAARGLQDAVVFTGFRSDVPALLAAMDCFVLASTRTEGVPQSLLQALASGVPVVASAVGGIPEVVRHEVTGLLVPPADVDALAAALSRVLQDREGARERAGAGRRLVEERFSHTASIARLLAVYEDLTRGAAHRGRR